MGVHVVLTRRERLARERLGGCSGLQVRGHPGKEGFLLGATLAYSVFLKPPLWQVYVWD